MNAFYRVEKNGKGPYHGSFLMRYLSEKGAIASGELSPEYMEARPVPSDDFALAPIWGSMPDEKREKYIFGFAEFDDISKWFNLKEEIEFLKQDGFKIVKYMTDKVIKGSKQAIALNDSLELIETLEF